MAWQVSYHPKVPEDLRAIPANMRERIRKAIEGRLMTDPDKYGERLRKDLQGAWKLSVGNYRIVFDLAAARKFVTVLLVAHRRLVGFVDYHFDHDPRFLRRVEAARASLKAGRGVRLEKV